MQKLRNVVSCGFIYLTAIYLVTSFGTVPGLLQVHAMYAHRGDGGVHASRFLLMGLSYFIYLIPTFLAAIYGAAWWALKRGMRSGRRWAIGASAVMVLTALPMLPAGFSMWRVDQGSVGMGLILLVFGAISLCAGISGLYAFSRKNYAGAPEKRAKVAGDGTHWLLDGLFWGIQIVGLLWIVHVYMGWAHTQHLPIASGGGTTVDWIVVLFTVVFIHESAHAIAGIAVGMKFRSFTVGPFDIREEMGRWRFRFRLNRVLSFSGATGIVSPDPEGCRWNEVAAIAAAPLVNLVTGAFAAALAYAAPGSSWESWWNYLALFAAISIVMGMSNLIPIHSETFYSDGGHIYQILLSRGPAADYARANRSVLATLVSPRRPRDYNIVAIRRALEHFTSERRAMFLHLWATNWCIDTGRLDEARLNLAAAERIYDQSPAAIPLECVHGIVIHEALLNRDEQAVRKYWALVVAGNTTQSAFYWLAKCAFHWMEDERTAAVEAFNRGLERLNSLADVGDHRFDRDQFRAMEEVMALQAGSASGNAVETALGQRQSVCVPAEA